MDGRMNITAKNIISLEYIQIYIVFKAGAPQGSEPLRCKPLQIIYHKTGVGQKKQEFSLEHLG